MVGARLSQATVAALLLSSAAGGCTCQRGEPAPRPAEAAPLLAPSASVSAPLALPKLSLPIGAALLADGAVVIAGLSVKEKVVRVARVEKDARVGWITDAFSAAEWAHDAELGVHSAGAGVVVTFRGRLDGGLKRAHVRLDAGGALAGRADHGAVTCATRSGFFWLDGRKAVSAELGEGPKRFPTPADLVGELSLFCDPSRASLVLDVDGSLSSAELGAAGLGPVGALLAEKDFTDEEREHALFSGGVGRPGLGVFRVGAEGGLALKLPGGAPRKLAGKLHEDDDLLLVDADERTLFAVSTQDHEGCAPGEDSSALPTLRTSRFSTSVHLLRVDLASYETTREELGRSTCGHQAGPFFLGVTRGKHVLGWSERAPTGGKQAKPARAPIAALSYRVFGATPAETVAHRTVLSADAVVDAGCTDSGCAAVWLERPEGKDDREPELPRVLRFPE